jgi:hypothetical protein
MARQVKNSRTASPIAGTIVHTISVARRGIAIDVDSAEPRIGERIADAMSADWATRQVAAAIQKTALATAGDMEET